MKIELDRETYTQIMMGLAYASASASESRDQIMVDIITQATVKLSQGIVHRSEMDDPPPAPTKSGKKQK